MRTLKIFLALALTGLMGLAALAIADTKTVDDTVKETGKLRSKPYLDITRAKAGHANDGRLLHTVTMRGKIRAEKSNERAILLINTKGSRTSSPEFVVLNRRVFEVDGDQLTKAGAADLGTSKRTWKYRFKPETIGDPKKYGWAALTSKGNTSDLAPNRRYAIHAP